MYKYFYFSMGIILMTACKNETKKDVLTIAQNPVEVIRQLDNPSEINSQLPRLFSNGKELYFSWVTRKDSMDGLNYSVLKDEAWTPTSEIIKGNDWFTNWADFPAIAENNGNILTNFLQKSATGTYTYDVKLNLYSAETQNWKQNFILHDDGTQSEHGFVSMLPFEETDFFVTWLDGRNTAGGHGDHDSHGADGAMTLRGAVVSSEGKIVRDDELDARICDCCQTAAAMTRNGPVVVYRDRSTTEVRDISIVRYDQGIWTEPQTVHPDNWEIAACPVNGPAVDAIGDNLAVAWFTASEGIAKVQIVFSEDGGASFGLPIRLDANETLGRVDVVMLSETEAAVSWMEDVNDEALIQLIKVDSNGRKGEVITLAKTEAARASGFPQLELLGGNLYAAWTSSGKDIDATIEMASVGLDSL